MLFRERMRSTVSVRTYVCPSVRYVRLLRAIIGTGSLVVVFRRADSAACPLPVPSPPPPPCGGRLSHTRRARDSTRDCAMTPVDCYGRCISVPRGRLHLPVTRHFRACVDPDSSGRDDCCQYWWWWSASNQLELHQRREIFLASWRR